MSVEIACECDGLPAHSHVYTTVSDPNGPSIDGYRLRRRVADPFDVRIWIDWKALARELVVNA